MDEAQVVDVDREVCFCFHVTLRKLLQHLRVCRPARASQLSECFGAGTGCGWCRPLLEQLFHSGDPERFLLPDAHDCRVARGEYLQEHEGASEPPKGQRES